MRLGGGEAGVIGETGAGGPGGGAAGARALIGRGLARADAWANRLYGWRWNPLYHSGALAVALLVVLFVTGVYLLLYYRLGDPYGSTARIAGQVWAGRWIRGLHRYASDAALVAIGVHALRMLVQGRSWGPRALAWVSGLVLLFAFLVCGWTGFVMVWDVHGQVLAVEGARLLDLLPIFSEPIGRTFVGERALPSAFFFLNLFAHIALPVGLLLVLWVHASRVARPKLFPPRPLGWAVVIALSIAAWVVPPALGAEADVLRLPGGVPLDVFYAWWVPLARRSPAAVTLGIGAALGLAVLLVPVWTRPRRAARPPASRVDERLCTGCEQCWLDCPYEAIAMVAREDGRATLVARVDPDLCVSCGICAGSCAPMGVGPPGRTGRDQLEGVRAFMAEARVPGRVVVVACDRSAIGGAAIEDAPVLPVSCAGSLHTSVVELLVRGGAAGVLVVSCPPRDCWNREGAVWLEQRLYHEREAELQARVDRRRVRLLYAGAGEAAVLRDALSAFRAELAALGATPAEARIELTEACETAPVEVEP